MQLARSRARTQGIPFDITEDDIHVPTFCPVLGLKLERAETGQGRNDHAPSLDRIIPELGYVKGNVIVISNKANRIKSNGSAEDLRRVATFYTRLENTECPTGQTTSNGNTELQNPKQTKPKTTSQSSVRHSTDLSKSKNTVLLLDGDIFAYKASFGSEEVIDLGDGIINMSTNLPEAERTVDHLIGQVSEKLKSKDIIVCLSDDTNFRKSIYKDYKATRDYRRKPLALRHIKAYMAKKHPARIKTGLEADDVLGILTTHPTLIKGKPVIVTIDKDLLQIPGRHYNPDKDEKRMVTPEQGDHQFYMQVLTGDAVDNFPGCPGIGPKRAEKILTAGSPQDPNNDNPWARIVAAYRAAGLTEEDAIVQARVARILRVTDYDFKRKEPILWIPNGL